MATPATLAQLAASLSIVLAAVAGAVALGSPSLLSGILINGVDGGCDITAHGAVAGNRSADAAANAAAVQAALLLCDRVRVPRGTFKIAPVVLPSHRTLWLDEGASLVGSDVWQVLYSTVQRLRLQCLLGGGISSFLALFASPTPRHATPTPHTRVVPPTYQVVTILMG